MSQPLASVHSRVVMKGAMKPSMDAVHLILKNASKRNLDPVRGIPYSFIGDIEYYVDKDKKFVGFFNIDRPLVKGNWTNDIHEMMRLAIAKANVTVDFKIVEFTRTTLITDVMKVPQVA